MEFTNGIEVTAEIATADTIALHPHTPLIFDPEQFIEIVSLEHLAEVLRDL